MPVVLTGQTQTVGVPTQNRLVLVRDFVNTTELLEDNEHLSSPAALRVWLRERELEPGRNVGPDDLRKAIALREALRALLDANNGLERDLQVARRTLDRAARNGGLAVRFPPADDGAVLAVEGSGADGALARIVGAAAELMVAGAWPELKACARAECRWAFVDRARNRSRRWCSMASCGNVMKARAYRQRSR